MHVDDWPYPHAIIDGHWDDDLLRSVVAEFPATLDRRWRRFDNRNEQKLAGNEGMLGPAGRQLVDSIAALAPQLEEAFGLTGLAPELIGGGFHQIPRGGKLGIHTDFNISPATGRRRAINALVFLNENWSTDWGGDLELWDADLTWRKIVPPLFNRTVIFATSDRSWHGHPQPLACPDGVFRRSLAVYFFDDAPTGPATSTVFREV